MRKIALGTVSALAVLAAMPASAAAATYAFTAGNINGTITTGNASSMDAGFFLLTRVDFTDARTSTADISRTFATSFLPFTAFNPQTLDFVNRGGGGRFSDAGFFSFQGPVSGTVSSFDTGDFISATVDDLFASVISSGRLQVIVPTSSVPEPATWGLMLGGFGLVGAGLRLRRRSVTFAAA